MNELIQQFLKYQHKQKGEGIMDDAKFNEFLSKFTAIETEHSKEVDEIYRNYSQKSKELIPESVMRSFKPEQLDQFVSLCQKLGQKIFSSYLAGALSIDGRVGFHSMPKFIAGSLENHFQYKFEKGFNKEDQ